MSYSLYTKLRKLFIVRISAMVKEVEKRNDDAQSRVESARPEHREREQKRWEKVRDQLALVERWKAWLESEAGDAFSLTVARDNPSQVSYYIEGYGDVIDYDTRKRAKISSFLSNRAMSAGFDTSDKERNVLSELWGVAVRKESTFTHTVERNEGVFEAYRSIGSCMQYKTNCTRFYAENPGRVGVLWVKDHKGKASARALLWSTDEGTTVIDRVYPNDTPAMPYIQALAQENGWSMREDNTFGGNDRPKLTCGKTYTVTMTDVGAYPYMDTFAYSSPFYEGGDICLYMEQDAPSDAEAWRNEDGAHPHGWEQCSHCSEGVDVDYEGTYVEGELYCDVCLSDLFCWVDYRDEWYPRAGCVWSEIEEAYLPENDAIEVSNNSGQGEDFCHVNNAVEILGDHLPSYAHVSMCTQVTRADGDEAWALDDDVVEDHNGVDRHKDDVVEVTLENGEVVWALMDDAVFAYDCKDRLCDDCIMATAGDAEGDWIAVWDAVTVCGQVWLRDDFHAELENRLEEWCFGNLSIMAPPSVKKLPCFA